MKIAVDPKALRYTAGVVITLAYDVGTIPRGLSGGMDACAWACGDAGLAEGINAFSGRMDSGVSELSRAVDLLGQVLVAVAGAYQETDAGAMPSAPTG